MNTLDIIGKPLKEASEIIKAAGMTYRVVCQDGKHYLCTADFKPNRLDLTVEGEQEIVTEC